MYSHSTYVISQSEPKYLATVQTWYRYCAYDNRGYIHPEPRRLARPPSQVLYNTTKALNSTATMLTTGTTR